MSRSARAPQVMLDDLSVLGCAAAPAALGTTTLTLTLAVPTDDKQTKLIRVLKEGAIVVGGSLNCTGSRGLPPVMTDLRERVLEDVKVRVVDGAAEVTVTLLTSTAGSHECFEYSQAEFFSGRRSASNVAASLCM